MIYALSLHGILPNNCVVSPPKEKSLQFGTVFSRCCHIPENAFVFNGLAGLGLSVSNAISQFRVRQGRHEENTRVGDRDGETHSLGKRSV